MNAIEENGGMKLTGMPYDELRLWILDEMEMKAFRADQLFVWVHQKRVDSFTEMTNISIDSRKLLEKHASITSLRIKDCLEAVDGTKKIAFLLSDGSVVESVLIPDLPRLTACLSTQVGCRFGCAFCQTGKMGFKRNLDPDEMVAQLYGLQEMAEDRISNVVFMGMGEPLDNFHNLSKSLAVISDERGICIGARKITVSTVGVPGGIGRLCDLERQYGLAVSLHSADESKRKNLMPAARILPLQQLKQDLIEYNRRTGRRVTLEYCLIEGLNDSLGDADMLSDYSSGIDCKINLLTYNPVEDGTFRPPAQERVTQFIEYLYPRCQAVTLRRSRGSEIAAACGQLGRLDS